MTISSFANTATACSFEPEKYNAAATETKIATMAEAARMRKSRRRFERNAENVLTVYVPLFGHVPLDNALCHETHHAKGQT